MVRRSSCLTDYYAPDSVCHYFGYTGKAFCCSRINPYFIRLLSQRLSRACRKEDSCLFEYFTLHSYQLYLKINDIEHTKTKIRSPQTNGIFERIHKTILQDSNQVALHKNLYADLVTLQKDLDEWLKYYNNRRTHQGKMCCGRPPWSHESMAKGREKSF